MDLTGKVALVTGGSRGIGAAVCRELARLGAAVAVNYAGNAAAANQTVEACRALGAPAAALQAAVADPAACEQLVSQVLDQFGRIDILVNNAGMQYRQNAYEYPLDVFDKVIAVNLRAGYQLAQLAAGHYRTEKKRGKIINLASLFSTFGGVNVSGYTCSKHGVVGMTRALSNEFAADGICVNAIAPGYIATELTKAIWSDPEKSRPMDERIPMGRWGKPQDFAGPAVFLASEASDYVSGIVLPVDGGYSAR